MNNFQKGNTREEKIDKFLDTLAWHFSEKSQPIGFFHTIGQIDEKLEKLNSHADELNRNIKEASESSEKLTRALNKITLTGVIVGGLGVLVAALTLIFEIYKFFIGR